MRGDIWEVRFRSQVQVDLDIRFGSCGHSYAVCDGISATIESRDGGAAIGWHVEVRPHGPLNEAHGPRHRVGSGVCAVEPGREYDARWEACRSASDAMAHALASMDKRKLADVQRASRRVRVRRLKAA